MPNELEPTVTGSESMYSGFAVDPDSTTQLFHWAIGTGTAQSPRQLWEFKFKINSQKITSSHIGSILTCNKWFCIPQILINTDGDLVIYIWHPTVHETDPATGLPLWMDPASDTPTTTPQYSPAGTLDMTRAIFTQYYSKYKVTLSKDQYYTFRMILDHTSHYASVLLNNTAIAMQTLAYTTDTAASQFKNCEFLDVDYVNIIDLDGNPSSSSGTHETFNVTTTTTRESENQIQDGVM